LLYPYAPVLSSCSWVLTFLYGMVLVFLGSALTFFDDHKRRDTVTKLLIAALAYDAFFVHNLFVTDYTIYSSEMKWVGFDFLTSFALFMVIGVDV